ncbi:hypothetical protein CLCR_10214 [Cladophialophora carrionii]|uniref:Fungal N-terminal domain-containing protein n=1 Tax=Cladophialophora carrionii TaxID=86049 RepID=A0A1C1CVK1_9EURO|nr:hypothetical protein CLCR_10214 [Cladophialophora carrionii]
MAEAAAVASIVGIASFGIQLTKTLYEFASTVSGARDEANYIARHVDLYANVLDILTERIDDDEPILTDAAFDLIDELRYQSHEIFTTIQNLLPVPKQGKDDISFLQKVKWNFAKSRVALLVGELDYLRSTVHLLVTVIFTGKKIRSHRRRAKSGVDISSSHDSDFGRHQIKAQNALLAQREAQEKLEILEVQAARQERPLSIDTGEVYTEPSSARMDIVPITATTLAGLTQSLTAYTDPAERQRVMLQESAHVLQLLLQQWTNIRPSASESTSLEAKAEPVIHNTPNSPEDAAKHSDTRTTNPAQPKYDVIDDKHMGASSQGIDPERPQTLLSEHLEASAAGRENRAHRPIREKSSRSMPPNPCLSSPRVTEILPPGWTKSWDPLISRFRYFRQDGEEMVGVDDWELEKKVSGRVDQTMELRNPPFRLFRDSWR